MSVKYVDKIFGVKKQEKKTKTNHKLIQLHIFTFNVDLLSAIEFLSVLKHQLNIP
jgi:hypothetical protein